MSMASPTFHLIVIRSPEIERAVKFYELLGLNFTLHSHGAGPQHYSSEENGIVFEIYPQRSTNDQTINTRIGFKIFDVDRTLACLNNNGVQILKNTFETEWGRCAIVQDFDGHVVELLSAEV